MNDLWEDDSIRAVVRTEGFELLLRRLHEMATHKAQQVVHAASREPIEEIRYKAGLVDGIRIVADQLKLAKEKR